jgi:putative SOS response-associated peptidase YedK
MKKIMGLKRKPSSPVFKEVGDNARVYPNYFAPVIVMEKGKRVIKPMRYRVRPSFSDEEIPSKYNVFNARIDSLEKRKTWNSIFLKNHGLFPFVRFFEWVEVKGKKKLITFYPDDHDIMWAPMIYDTWRSEEGEFEFSSFAIITNDPPDEIDEMGHDRCPIFLKESKVSDWLKPEKLSKQQVYEILSQQEKTHFKHDFNVSR